MLDELFAFKIGEALVLKASAEINGLTGQPALVVSERLLIECEGGAQKNYDCRLIWPHEHRWATKPLQFGGNPLPGGFVRFKESELTRFDVDEYRKANADPHKSD